MVSYQILTDSGSDLSEQQLKAWNVQAVPLTLNFRGAAIDDSVDAGIADLYAGLRAGEPASTSAINPDRWTRAMEEVLSAGQDLLVLAFSGGLSATAQSAVIAANELQEKYPQRKISVVDTLCASLGQGLLVWYAAQKRGEGLSLEELTAWVEEHKQNLCMWFTVDDLMFLKRGGRVNAATALVGTMLGIKPILHVDEEGHLINVGKVRGRKASLDALCAKVGELGLPGENETVFISHGDSLKDAQYLAQKLQEKYGIKEVVIGYVGAVIGSHSGPGTIALFFLGAHR